MRLILPVRLIFLTLVLLVPLGLWIPTGVAAPQILPVTDSMESVTAGRDFLLVSCRDLFNEAIIYTITGPDGSQGLFSSVFGLNTDPNCQLGSAPTSQGPCITSVGIGNVWQIFDLGAVASLVGKPLDGTWHLQATIPGGVVASKGMCLQLDGKFSQITTAGESETIDCFYNWRSAGVQYQNTALLCRTTPLVPENDPNNFVFFSDQAPEDDDPQGFTTDSTVSCPSTATIRGVWIRGSTQTGNTFVSFYHAQGTVPGDQDLRDNLGVSNTGYVDDGAGANGDHSATILYNNVVGNSYQFVVKAGAAGTEQLGAVLFIPPLQCTIVEPNIPSAFNHEEDAFNLEVSQAQCSSDQVEFVLTHPAHGPGGTATVNVTIFDGDTNAVIMVIDESQMFNVGAVDQLRHFNRTFSPGPWAALALHDDLVATADWFDGAAFNVPAGNCFSPFNQVQLDETCKVTSNCLATGGSGELQFADMSIQDSWSFLFWMVVIAVGMKRGWPWIVGAGLLAVPDTFGFSGYPINFIAGVMLLLISMTIQWFTGGGKPVRDGPVPE